MIDYLTLLLVNMVAALVTAALFFVKGLGGSNTRSWSAAFAISGLVAFVGGLHLALTWPIPQTPDRNLTWANVAYGEPSVMLGVLWLGIALSLAKGWDLLPLSAYAFFAGLAVVVIGVRMGHLQLTGKSMLPTAGFVLTGLAGVLTPLVLAMPRVAPLRWLVSVILLAAAAIWALTGYGAFWGHLEKFSAMPK